MFAPFPQDSEMIGPPKHTWMLNFRVDDLDAMVDQLRGAGETVDVDHERYPNGRFAELRDPEGNGIQLWQPMDPASGEDLVQQLVLRARLGQELPAGAEGRGERREPFASAAASVRATASRMSVSICASASGGEAPSPIES